MRRLWPPDGKRPGSAVNGARAAREGSANTYLVLLTTPDRDRSSTRPAIDELRFQWLIERLHALGPRAVGELLLEIGAARSCLTDIELRLERFSRLDPDIVIALGGGRFLPPPLREVA